MVDPWDERGDDTRSQWFSASQPGAGQEALNFVRARFEGQPVEIVRALSYQFLIEEIRSDCGYDLIYVDGDHHAEAVYLDLILSWQLLLPGGVVAGDDYNWVSRSTGVKEVRKGVRKFQLTIGREVTTVDGDHGGLKQYYLVKGEDD